VPATHANIERPIHQGRTVSIEFRMGIDEQTEIGIQGLTLDL